MTDILAAIVRAEPDWDALAARVSPGLVGITKRCLRKKRRERLHSAGDIGLTLEQLAEEGATRGPAGTTAEPPQDVARRHISMTTAAGLLLAVAVVSAGLGSWLSRSEIAAEPQRRFSIQLPEGTFLPAGVGTDLAISPDGSTIVYLADDLDSRRLYVRGINDFEARPLPGTEGSGEPFFSPDGEWIGFGLDGGLRKISLANLELYPLCDSGSWGSWGDDGNVFFTRDDALWRVPETGGQPELVTEPRPDEGIPALIRSHVLPGSKVVLFEIGEHAFGGVGALFLESGEVLRISTDGSDPFYSVTGHIVFPREHVVCRSFR
jgi:serine/threonine-protein kinase